MAGEVVRLAVLDAGERPLVFEDQRLVGGIQLNAVERRVAHAAGAHEPYGAVDFTRQLVVPSTGVCAAGERRVPGVDLVERCAAAGRVGPHEVQRRGGRVVRPQHALRGPPCDRRRARSPCHRGRTADPLRSMSALRGFAYCPAIRPTFTTGIDAP